MQLPRFRVADNATQVVRTLTPKLDTLPSELQNLIIEYFPPCPTQISMIDGAFKELGLRVHTYSPLVAVILVPRGLWECVVELISIHPVFSRSPMQSASDIHVFGDAFWGVYLTLYDPCGAPL